MRAAVLLLLLACKDQPAAVAPKVGSASAVTPTPAKTPPVRSAPLDAAKARELARRDVAGWTREVRLADGKGVDLRYRRAAIAVTVHVARCFDCLPMEDARWRAKSDVLRALVAAEVRDRTDTTWELGMTELAGTPAAWTYHAGYGAPAPSTGSAYGTAYTLYFNDGVNMLRVVAEYAGDAPASREAMIAAAPKAELAQLAAAFADDVVHAW